MGRQTLKHDKMTNRWKALVLLKTDRWAVGKKDRLKEQKMYRQMDRLNKEQMDRH